MSGVVVWRGSTVINFASFEAHCHFEAVAICFARPSYYAENLEQAKI